MLKMHAKKFEAEKISNRIFEGGYDRMPSNKRAVSEDNRLGIKQNYEQKYAVKLQSMKDSDATLRWMRGLV